MKKPKRHYKVYVKRTGFGCYDTGKPLYTFVGETWAVSEAQAINNVRFRTDGKASNSWIIGDYAEQGDVMYQYIAEEIKDQKNVFDRGYSPASGKTQTETRVVDSTRRPSNQVQITFW